MKKMGFGPHTHQYFNILGLSLILLMVYCVTYRAKAHACHQSSPILAEVNHQRQGYNVPHDIGLPDRREPGGTR